VTRRLRIGSGLRGRVLIIAGLGLIGAFVPLYRWIVPMSRNRWLGAGGVGLELLAIGVLLATLLEIAGTVALLGRQPSGFLRAVDVAFVAVGSIASGLGVWLCSGLLLEAITRW
jgi:hypothetical protein